MMREIARSGWDWLRIAVSELSWRRFRRVFRKKRRAVVEGPIMLVELVGAVLWMAWESWRREKSWQRERQQQSRQQQIRQ